MKVFLFYLAISTSYTDNGFIRGRKCHYWNTMCLDANIPPHGSATWRSEERWGHVKNMIKLSSAQWEFLSVLDAFGRPVPIDVAGQLLFFK